MNKDLRELLILIWGAISTLITIMLVLFLGISDSIFWVLGVFCIWVINIAFVIKAVFT